MNHLKHLLALAVTALTLGTAQASTVGFTGQIDTGPLTGQTFNGQFSYEDGLLTGSGYELIDLTAWTLNAFGQTFTTIGATIAPQAGFYDGLFVGVNAGYSSSTLSVNLVDGFFDVSNAYVAYETPAGGGYGSYSISAVPEPASWALAVTGLGLVGVVSRRRPRALSAA